MLKIENIKRRLEGEKKSIQIFARKLVRTEKKGMFAWEVLSKANITLSFNSQPHYFEFVNAVTNVTKGF